MSKKDRAYHRRHDRVRRVRGKADTHFCKCGERAKCWSQKHGTDGESPDDYQAMCWKCHHKYDDRWNAAERAKVSESLKKVWANDEERRQQMSIRMSQPRGKRRTTQGGEA